MANVKCFIFLLVTTALVSALPRPEVEIITQPKPGQEYVFVQSTASGARPIARKDKNIDQERPFETSHKLPPSLTFALNQHEAEENEKPVKGKIVKRDANPGEPAAPPPAGAIKLDVRKLLEMYKKEISTTTAKSSTTTEKPKSTSSSSRRRGSNRRVKKEAKNEDAPLKATSPSPVLTTGAPVPKRIDDDIPLVAAGSEKQRSRIQVKKGPNGQDYEYEYVYYYYDDDDDAKDNPKVSNSHDGPARNQISRGDKTRGEKTSVAPEANEVVPSASRQRTRGRQLGEEETVNEERLPANTRFPPRSRNLNTTPIPEEETKATSRGRGRGRPTTEGAVAASEDNVSDETQGSRGRTRANVRRPSLDLVDNATFNTHTNAAGAEPPSGGPSFPTELPAGPVRFLGATPNERMDLPDEATDDEKPKKTEPAVPSETDEESATVVPSDAEGTTPMSAMDKVALDLYAVVQGTQKLSGEDGELSIEEGSTDSSDNTDVTTVESETEAIETTTPTTTTTTTTTTTPAPTTTTTTTTTTEAPLVRGGKYRPRAGAGRRTTHAASTTEAAPAEKPKKFGRPGFNRSRLGGKTTPEPATEPEATKEESKPVSHSRPTLSRGRFGASRPRGRTTAAPTENSENHEDSASSSTSAPAGHRPSLPRSRPSFNLRSRGRTTAAPTDSESSGKDAEAHESSPAEVSSTTARNRRISSGGAVRPLRPGPRLNLAGRGRGAATSTTEAPAEDHVTGDEEQETGDEEHAEKESEAPAENPIHRIKNRKHINVQARPKAAASAPVQVRRVNPLLARRRPGQTTEASSSEAPQEAPATEETPAEEKETEAPASSSTTEEPRGLNKLLAGRRRLANRQSGTTNH